MCLNDTKPIPSKGQSITVSVTSNSETILEFIDEYRNLLDKYGFTTELTDDRYLVFDLLDLVKIDIKPVLNRKEQ